MSVDLFRLSVVRLNYSALTWEQKEPTLGDTQRSFRPKRFLVQ